MHDVHSRSRILGQAKQRSTMLSCKVALECEDTWSGFGRAKSKTIIGPLPV